MKKITVERYGQEKNITTYNLANEHASTWYDNRFEIFTVCHNQRLANFKRKKPI
jgi:hypothetical protein